MDAKKIQRINELYHLDKSVGLTPQQKKRTKKSFVQNIFRLSGPI